MPAKHIRLDSEFSVVGAFWAPGSSERVCTGNLTVDERRITFTTSPEYESRLSMNSLSSVIRFANGPAEKLPVLHGFTEDGLCTLCQLIEASQPGLVDFGTGQSITAMSYQASLCVTGIHFHGVSDKCLMSARYTFTGLSDWLPSAGTESWEGDQVVLRLPTNPRDVFDFGLRESHARITLKVISELTTSELDGARLTRSVVFVEVESPTPESISWYLDVGNRLENLFSLLTGSSLALETMFVYRGGECGHVVAKRKKHVEPFRPLDCVRCTPSQLANSVAVWLSENPRFRSVENLALGVVRKGDLFTETEFLSLAQALEGFHRVTSQTVPRNRAMFRALRRKISALLEQENVDPSLAERLCISISHANDPSFSSRLVGLCERLSSSLRVRMGIDLDEFVSDVVVTRNFYTHTGGSARTTRKRKPLSGKELFLLNQKMRALLRGVLLSHLGIPEGTVAELLVREATRWH